MPTLRKETSAESAAGFLASQERRRARAAARREARRARLARERRRARAAARREARRARLARERLARLGRLPAAAPDRAGARRIVVDFAEPTLRLVHDVLLDAMHANIEFGDRGALLMIAEQMVAIALGDPPCDDPPLTDREAT